MYRTLRRALFLLPPERIHTWIFALLRAVTVPRPLRRALSRWLAPTDPVLAITVFGVRFAGPLGLAAGFDKDGRGVHAWGALGFGYAEVGTVTAQAQPGNPRPRIERFPEARALLNWMGFPNHGADTVAERLAAPRRTIVGVNVGKSKVAPVEEATADYRATVRRVAPHADYLALNVSSPNTPGLRSLQAADALDALVHGVQEELAALGLRIPLLVKIAPDLSDEEIDAVADLAVRRGLDGIVAINTTTDRGGLVSRLRAPGEPGGVSGAPIAARSLEVLRRLRDRVGDRLVLVSVGGVESGEDAWARLQAGATLVQAYTGFVYGGPLWAWRANRVLAKRMRAAV